MIDSIEEIIKKTQGMLNGKNTYFPYEDPKIIKKEKKANNPIKQFALQEINEKIAKLAARLNYEYKLFSSIGLADILIGSTALYLDAPLLTLNKYHFKLIPNLIFA